MKTSCASAVLSPAGGALNVVSNAPGVTGKLDERVEPATTIEPVIPPRPFTSWQVTQAPRPKKTASPAAALPSDAGAAAPLSTGVSFCTLRM